MVKKRNMLKNEFKKVHLFIFFLILFSFIFFQKVLAETGYDRCHFGKGWSEPQKAAETCGWGYYYSGAPKYGYVKDCCCCYLKSHIHDLGEIFQNKRLQIEYTPGWSKGCRDTMTVYSSLDGENWNEILSKRVTQPTWHPKTTFQEIIEIKNSFRYIKISIPHCYNDYSSAKVIGDIENNEDQIEGSLSVSKNTACTGEKITFTISATDEQGIEKVCVHQEGGAIFCKFCNNQTFCVKNITFSENTAGTFRFYGKLYGKKVNGDQEIGKTNPEFVKVTFEKCFTHDHKVCFDNDVYWANPCGEIEDLYEDCGESEWTNEYKCSGNILQRKWIEKGCQNAQCFSIEKWKDYKDCSLEGKVCQNGQCILSKNYPACGTLTSSLTILKVGETVKLTIEGKDEDGLDSLCLFYNNDWHCQTVSGNSASYTWSITENTPGKYNFCGKIKGRTPDDEIESIDTTPSCITVEFQEIEENCPTCNNYYYYYYYQSQNQKDHLGCYNNDVYWFDQYGNRLNKYQECGEDFSSDWSEPYCKNNKVYKKRTNYKRGCQNGSCYEKEEIEEKLIKVCLENQICENGECKEKETIECESGPCCENGKFKPKTSVCDVKIQTQYGCPWGTGCGYDVGKRTRSRFRYCSGNSSDCTGNWGDWSPWTPWQVSDYCPFNQKCVPGKERCQYSPDCTFVLGSYIKHYSKKCIDNKLYWVDSNGIIQEIYRDCSDNNSCTIDSCQNGKCINELRCDGSTCSIGDKDYCSSCNHCGDKKCNCNENEKSCPQDCLISSVSSLSQKEKPSLLASIFIGKSLAKWFIIFLEIGFILLIIILIILGINYYLDKRDERYKKMILEIIRKKSSS